MSAIRTNKNIERNAVVKGRILWTPAIQNGYGGAPAVTEDIDYSVFKKTRVEKETLLTLKRQNIEGRRAEYGKDYKKHLNISANAVGFPNGGHFTF